MPPYLRYISMKKRYFYSMIQPPLQHCVEVIYEKTDHCPFRGKPNLFFQLVYLISGGGFVNLNGNSTAYHPGDLFLITPNDNHCFEIDSVTEFVLIKFSPEYVKEYRWKSFDHVQFLLHHAPQLSGALMQTVSDRFQVKHIIDLLLHELDHIDHYNQDLRRYFVNALIVIAARNIAKANPAQLKTAADNRILEIVSYIQANISNPAMLTASAIGKRFGISQTYLGTFFKHQSGETIQHFISNYKLRQIEYRLRFSDMRVGEIVAEFGFSDESHLNKFFKKQRGVSLTEFRKSNREEVVKPNNLNRISNLGYFQ